jgi:hypothetical protein
MQITSPLLASPLSVSTEIAAGGEEFERIMALGDPSPVDKASVDPKSEPVPLAPSPEPEKHSSLTTQAQNAPPEAMSKAASNAPVEPLRPVAAAEDQDDRFHNVDQSGANVLPDTGRDRDGQQHSAAHAFAPVKDVAVLPEVFEKVPQMSPVDADLPEMHGSSTADSPFSNAHARQGDNAKSAQGAPLQHTLAQPHSGFGNRPAKWEPDAHQASGPVTNSREMPAKPAFVQASPDLADAPVSEDFTPDFRRNAVPSAGPQGTPAGPEFDATKVQAAKIPNDVAQPSPPNEPPLGSAQRAEHHPPERQKRTPSRSFPVAGENTMSRQPTLSIERTGVYGAHTAYSPLVENVPRGTPAFPQRAATPVPRVAGFTQAAEAPVDEAKPRYARTLPDAKAISAPETAGAHPEPASGTGRASVAKPAEQPVAIPVKTPTSSSPVTIGPEESKSNSNNQTLPHNQQKITTEPTTVPLPQKGALHPIEPARIWVVTPTQPDFKTAPLWTEMAGQHPSASGPETDTVVVNPQIAESSFPPESAPPVTARPQIGRKIIPDSADGKILPNQMPKLPESDQPRFPKTVARRSVEPVALTDRAVIPQRKDHTAPVREFTKQGVLRLDTTRTASPAREGGSPSGSFLQSQTPLRSAVRTLPEIAGPAPIDLPSMPYKLSVAPAMAQKPEHTAAPVVPVGPPVAANLHAQAAAVLLTPQPVPVIASPADTGPAQAPDHPTGGTEPDAAPDRAITAARQPEQKVPPAPQHDLFTPEGEGHAGVPAPQSPARPVVEAVVPPPMNLPAAITPAQLPRILTQAVERGDDSRIDLALRPEELGGLRFEMKTTGDKVHITLFVERPDALDLIRRHADQFLADLRHSGFTQATLSFGGWAHNGSQPHHPPPAGSPDDAVPFTGDGPLQQTSTPPVVVFGRLDLRL